MEIQNQNIMKVPSDAGVSVRSARGSVVRSRHDPVLINILINKIEDLHENNVACELHLNSLTKKLTKKSNENESLLQLIEVLETKLYKSDKELERLTTEATAATAGAKGSTGVDASMNTDLQGDSLQQKEESLVAIEAVEKQLNSLRQQTDDLEERNDQLFHQLAVLQIENKQLAETLESKSQQLLDETQRHEEVKQNLQRDFENQQYIMNEKCTQLEQKCTHYEQKCTQLEQENRLLIQQFIDVPKERHDPLLIEILLNKIKELRAVTLMDEAVIVDLEKILDGVVKDRDRCETVTKATIATLEEGLKEERGACEAIVGAMLKHMDALLARAASLEAVIMKKSDENHSLKHQISDLLEAKQQSLQKSLIIEGLKKDINILKISHESERLTLSQDHENECNKLHLQIKELIEEKEIALNATVNAHMMDEMTSNNHKITRDELEEVKREFEMMERQVGEYRRLVEEQEQAVKRLEMERDFMKMKSENTRALLDDVATYVSHQEQEPGFPHNVLVRQKPKSKQSQQHTKKSYKVAHQQPHSRSIFPNFNGSFMSYVPNGSRGSSGDGSRRSPIPMLSEHLATGLSGSSSRWDDESGFGLGSSRPMTAPSILPNNNHHQQQQNHQQNHQQINSTSNKLMMGSDYISNGVKWDHGQSTRSSSLEDMQDGNIQLDVGGDVEDDVEDESKDTAQLQQSASKPVIQLSRRSSNKGESTNTTSTTSRNRQQKDGSERLGPFFAFSKGMRFVSSRPSNGNIKRKHNNSWLK